MLKFILVFFGAWYLLTLIFPGTRNTAKGIIKGLHPPTAQQELISGSATVRRMTSILCNHINRSITPADASQIANAVISASRRFALDPYLILGVISAESNAYVWAINGGSLGLMQVMPKWWDGELRKQGIIKKRDDYFTIESAVMAGSFVLRLCLDRARGDVRKALDYYTGKANGRYAMRVFDIINMGKNGGR